MGFFKTIVGTTPTAWQFLLLILVSGILSVGFAVIYNWLKSKSTFYKDIPFTLALFPIVTTALVLLLNLITFSYTGTSEEARYGRICVAMLAVVIMIRFRSKQRSTEDLVYIYFLTAIGFILGLGYIYLALVLYIFVTGLIIVLYKTGFPYQSNYYQTLKISIPEDLNFEHAFDDIFEEFTANHRLIKVKTSDMGTMFVLEYHVQLKKGVSQKDMIDKIRSRNANLNVIMVVKKFFDDDLND